MPVLLAERLVCYSSIGWVPAAAVMGLALARHTDGSLDRWMSQLIGVWGPWQSIELLILIGAGAVMGFEVLVWIGVRQTKHANVGSRGLGPSPKDSTSGQPLDTDPPREGERFVET